MTVALALAIARVACLAGEEAEKKVAKKLDEVRTQAGAGFIVERDGIFIVAGNVPRIEFDGIVEHTIRRAANALWASYFTKRPDYPIVIWLFGDDKSYRDGAKRLFGDTQVSHFGYFRPWDQTMVMNVGTGTGTLVHEMTHALLKPDFPDCPTWFEEGLASLHEQCQLLPNGIRGFVNWRLPDLQKAIAAGRLVPLEKLVATTTGRFRGANEPLHYAEARYLVLYLQHKGLLARFYKEFHAGVKKDPTGAKTLAAVAGKTLGELEGEWVAWVKTLRFPER
ncbi:MAG: hypothetical protein FJ290_24885 [Planctomycetes bacterium]|nr:hypothetical protein [Planctomycetota bacterium]